MSLAKLAVRQHHETVSSDRSRREYRRLLFAIDQRNVCGCISYELRARTSSLGHGYHKRVGAQLRVRVIQARVRNTDPCPLSHKGIVGTAQFAFSD